MKKLFLLTFALGLYINAFATTPETILAKKANIEQQLSQLDQIEKIILQEGLTYQELAVKYPELVAKTNVASENEEGIFSGDRDAPLGIPGFWWGFCLGWVGLLIVYLTMDEGASRKEQVKNALWGCVISTVVGFIFYIGLWATLFAAST